MLLVNGYLVGSGANLAGADLTGANFASTILDLSGVDFSGAILTGVNFTNSFVNFGTTNPNILYVSTDGMYEYNYNN